MTQLINALIQISVRIVKIKICGKEKEKWRETTQWALRRGRGTSSAPFTAGCLDVVFLRPPMDVFVNGP